jgi:hypothetical protein
MRHPLLLPVLVVALAACGTDAQLPPAGRAVTQQQITLYALTGTSVLTPSAYSMSLELEVRTDQTSDFDFAFDIGIDSVLGVGTTGDTVAVLMPRGALGLTADGGLQRSTLDFDSIVAAPLNGYERLNPLVVTQGSVLIAASRLLQCTYQIIRPRAMAKLVVDQLDLVQRRAVIRLVIDPNCGYLSLQPGIPSF